MIPATKLAVLVLHPNRREFKGVLTFVDRPSDLNPEGSRGHRIILAREAVETSLHTLVGMGVNFSPEKRHNYRKKCGVITDARLIEDRIEIGGYLYARHFPEVIHHLEACAEDYGMSYEIDDAKVEDMLAKTWTVLQCWFSGAAILPKKKAAYAGTSFELKPCAKDERCQP